MGGRAFGWLGALACAVSIVAAACGTVTPSAAPTPRPTAAPTAAPTNSVAATASPTPQRTAACCHVHNDGHVIVRWLVGLGPGEDPAQIATEQKVVTDFNAAQDRKPYTETRILLSLEVVQRELANDTLRQEIAAGNAPDLIGPMSPKALAAFPGEFMNLGPLVSAAHVRTDGYSPKLLDALKDPASGAQLGLPFAVTPSFIFYNKALFDAAGLSYPPTEVGDEYILDGVGVDWNWDTVREVAMRLSRDGEGRNATQAGFDPAHQTQWGFGFQGADGRRVAAAFGSGSLVAPGGARAQFPAEWKLGWNWYYDGI
jgi:multiple sugar transport system substrate-binding protein